ncbi:MAG TPA: CsbD family protein [Ktedonosporobacter sp.]|nr:CsbD family protein [Ktedonosporobacter sp.]
MKDNSLQERIQGNWKQLVGGVHHEWGKLTSNDIEQIKGDVEMLAGKIENLYGVTKAEAKKQIEGWVAKYLASKANSSKESDTSEK